MAECPAYRIVILAPIIINYNLSGESKYVSPTMVFTLISILSFQLFADYVLLPLHIQHLLNSTHPVFFLYKLFLHADIPNSLCFRLISYEILWLLLIYLRTLLHSFQCQSQPSSGHVQPLAQYCNCPLTFYPFCNNSLVQPLRTL